ncbi:hypothetical protein KUV80_12520 [Fictibacillus nanhaiensis]|uniref:hypothetical protein n=1 Tax=Fictibacillus nanhaiensis TaxID=742169 RepID=UPI001C93BE2A|nr:hypothetical protein [Fictibacillus nanhaiensis]MBY6037490.1 hypothetical protein [Fictibacillus nanhaiensis]
MKKDLHCEKCLMPIECRDDLVTVWAFFKIRPYHEACYAHSLKGAATLFVGNTPINGFSGNVTAIAAFLFMWIPLFTDLTLGITVIGSLVVLTRMYSFIRFEKKMPL